MLQEEEGEEEVTMMAVAAVIDIEEVVTDLSSHQGADFAEEEHLIITLTPISSKLLHFNSFCR